MPLPTTVIGSPGKRFHLLDQLREIAAHVDLVGLDAAGAVPHEQRDDAGVLPWIRSCCGAVTIASATSGTVSETRAMPAPTLRIVERPTRRSMLVASGGAAAGPPVIAPGEPLNDVGCCACGVATRMTMM